ncbi:hypothetical protein L1987_42388 [Smallanthus sonchifolius]|uniref:Uncharacterized protein n=1 Tax=Smallanthus sonchifolius TaxID=185202 RepID=A0ACB9GJQ0_9ASTR|nr:hypothetical protein L1987_42388 [Smallanthus sonchifolius]
MSTTTSIKYQALIFDYSSSSLIMDNSDINLRHINDGEGDDDSMEDNDSQIESQNAESSSQNQRKMRWILNKLLVEIKTLVKVFLRNLTYMIVLHH